MMSVWVMQDMYILDWRDKCDFSIAEKMSSGEESR